MLQLALFPIVLGLAMGAAILLRSAILPFATSLQDRYGYSREFVSELTLALPMGVSILVALLCLTLLLA